MKDPHDGKSSPIGFQTYADFLRTKQATTIQHRQNQSAVPHTPERNTALPGNCHVRITGERQWQVDAYPAVFTYKNIHKETPTEPLWIDGDICLAFDINDVPLTIDKVYSGQVYDGRLWSNAAKYSTFVAVDELPLEKVQSDCAKWHSIIQEGKCANATVNTGTGSCLCVPTKSVLMYYNKVNHSLRSIKPAILACPIDEDTPGESFWLVVDVVAIANGYALRGRLKRQDGTFILLNLVECDTSDTTTMIQFHTNSSLLCTGTPATNCNDDGVTFTLICGGCPTIPIGCEDIEVPPVLCVNFPGVFPPQGVDVVRDEITPGIRFVGTSYVDLTPGPGYPPGGFRKVSVILAFNGCIATLSVCASIVVDPNNDTSEGCFCEWFGSVAVSSFPFIITLNYSGSDANEGSCCAPTPTVFCDPRYNGFANGGNASISEGFCGDDVLFARSGDSAIPDSPAYVGGPAGAKSVTKKYIRPKRPIPCLHLGPKIIPDCGCVDFNCLKGLGAVQHLHQCQTCELYEIGLQAIPEEVFRIDDLPGHFNASILEWDGRMLMISRKFKSLYLSELTQDFKSVLSTKMLTTKHEKSQLGSEDARFYEHNGELRITFTGVYLREGVPSTTILNASFSDELEISNVWEPIYEKRAYPREKNWMPFTDDSGKLKYVYSITPHRILEADGIKVASVTEILWYPRWAHGILRGGAAPVRVGNEFWHFFHGVAIDTPQGNEYTLGLYTFDANAPHKPMRISPLALLRDTAEKRPFGENPAIYPCGVVRRGDKWYISYGLHNNHVEIVTFDHAELERVLVPIK